MNNTAGPSGLVPTFLVLGAMSHLSLPTIDLSRQNERMNALGGAQKKCLFVASIKT